MDRRMTMLALIPAAFMFAIGTVMGKTMTKTWEKRQQAFSDLSDFAQENFSGIAVIKAFVKELKELIAFRKLNKDNEEINVKYTRISVLLEVMVTFFVESVICVILGYGGYLANNNTLTNSTVSGTVTLTKHGWRRLQGKFLHDFYPDYPLALFILSTPFIHRFVINPR